MKDPRASLKYMYRQYRKSARYRGLEFDLTIEEFENIVTRDCFYCKEWAVRPVTNGKKSGSIPYYCNGIDRMDNDKGYIFENVVSSCWRCNRAKSDESLESYITWLKQVAEFSPHK